MVTGGAGFIGSHLVDALLAKGVDVTVIDDLSSGDRANLPDDVAFIEADVASPGVTSLIAAARPELVLHAAAQISAPASVVDPVRDREVNLVGTHNVVRGAAGAQARRIVFVSSGGAIYGEASLATEDTIPAPQNPYGVHKLAAESYVRLGQIPYGIVRFSNVYGPRQRPGLEGAVVAVFMDACRTDGAVTIHGDGHQSRDFLSVRDAVSGTLAVADTDISGIWNVATGRATTVLGLLAEVVALTGHQPSVNHVATRPGDVRVSSLSPMQILQQLGWSAQDSLASGLQFTLESMEG